MRMTDLVDERTPALASARSSSARLRPPRPRAPTFRNPRRDGRLVRGMGRVSWRGEAVPGGSVLGGRTACDRCRGTDRGLGRDPAPVRCRVTAGLGPAYGTAAVV